MRERCVGNDAVEPEIRIGVERFLLLLDDELVLEEPLHHRVAQRKRDGRVLQVVVVQIVPEEMRRAPRLGGEELAVAVFLRALAVALLQAVARRREQRLQEEDARDVHAPDVPSVHRFQISDDLLVERRAGGVHVPALDAEAVVEALDRHRLRLERVLLRAAERLRVHEGEVREVGEVVDDQQVVRVVVHVVRHAAPARILEIGNAQDGGRRSERRIAHPDPDDVLLLDHRVAAHAQALGDVLLPGNLDALALAVELQAVVHAAHVIAFQAPVGEQRAAMAAAVVERDHLAAVALVEQHRLLEDRARDELAVDQLVVPRGHVPAVHQEGSGGCGHWSFLQWEQV